MPLIVVDKELRELLVEVGRQSGFHVAVSEAVRGRVRGRLPPGSARETIERLSRMHGFEWFFDGSVLHVSAATETTSRLLVLGDVAPAALAATLDGLGLGDPRWPVRVAGGVAFVAGPPRYVALVEQVLGVLARRPAAAAEPSATSAAILVFRGRMAGSE